MSTTGRHPHIAQQETEAQSNEKADPDIHTGNQPWGQDSDSDLDLADSVVCGPDHHPNLPLMERLCLMGYGQVWSPTGSLPFPTQSFPHPKSMHSTPKYTPMNGNNRCCGNSSFYCSRGTYVPGTLLHTSHVLPPSTPRSLRGQAFLPTLQLRKVRNGEHESRLISLVPAAETLGPGGLSIMLHPPLWTWLLISSPKLLPKLSFGLESSLCLAL